MSGKITCVEFGPGAPDSLTWETVKFLKGARVYVGTGDSPAAAFLRAAGIGFTLPRTAAEPVEQAAAGTAVAWLADGAAETVRMTEEITKRAGQAGVAVDILRPSPRTLEALEAVMERLRSAAGCPWDREQTHATLKPYLLEESYEVIEAIDAGSDTKLCEELGDVLLQVVFHAQLARETGRFTLGDVVESIVAKMIRRHPHVFGDVQVANSGEVLVNWDRIKAGEKGYEERKSALSGIPAHFPALMKAYKLQAKAAKVGFDWDSIDGAFAKVREESGELAEALAAGDQAQVAEEMGDLLFAAVNVSRFAGVEPETALLRTADKFARRFRYIETTAAQAGRRLEEMTLAEMDALWEAAKRMESDDKDAAR